MQFDQFVSGEHVEVQSAEGQVIGELAAVHLDPADDTARFVEIKSAAEETNLVVPIGDDATIVDDAIVVHYSTQAIEHGPTVGVHEALSVGEISAIVDYYRAGQVDLGKSTLTDRSTGPMASVGSVVKKWLPPIRYVVAPDTAEVSE